MEKRDVGMDKNSSFSLFSSGCEHCEDWFHGKCVDITEKQAKYIKRYYCKECRKKNKGLDIVYK